MHLPVCGHTFVQRHSLCPHFTASDPYPLLTLPSPLFHSFPNNQLQELEQQQQSLLERHQHIIADMSLNSPGSSSSSSMDRLSLDFGFGPVGAAAAGLGGMLRMQPTNNRTPNQQRQQQQVPAAAPHVMRAIVGWLESREVEKYHRGLLLAVMVSSGLWQDSMWKQLEGGEAFR